MLPNLFALLLTLFINGNTSPVSYEDIHQTTCKSILLFTELQLKQLNRRFEFKDLLETVNAIDSLDLADALGLLLFCNSQLVSFKFSHNSASIFNEDVLIDKMQADVDTQRFSATPGKHIFTAYLKHISIAPHCLVNHMLKHDIARALYHKVSSSAIPYIEQILPYLYSQPRYFHKQHYRIIKSPVYSYWYMLIFPTRYLPEETIHALQQIESSITPEEAVSLLYIKKLWNSDRERFWSIGRIIHLPHNKIPNSYESRPAEAVNALVYKYIYEKVEHDLQTYSAEQNQKILFLCAYRPDDYEKQLEKISKENWNKKSILDFFSFS